MGPYVSPAGAGSSGARTRTPNNWTRTSCVADYTTPEWATCTLSSPRRPPDMADPFVEADQPPVADDAAHADRQGLPAEVGELGGRRLGTGAGGRHVAVQSHLPGDL